MAGPEAEQIEEHLPGPPPQRAPWVFASALVLICAGVIAIVLTGTVGARRLAPPPLGARAATPAPAATALDPKTGRRIYVSDTRPASSAAIVSRPPSAAGRRAGGVGGAGGAAGTGTGSDGAGSAPGGGGSGGAHHAGTGGRGTATEAPPESFAGGALAVPISARWMEGFYPIYAQAQRAFGVNWLLIASIHRQETAFSTAPSTYHGLNFAHCCAGPMQFNVTDGPPSTWAQVKDSYLYGRRPAHYNHQTAHHPSIYDDFDSIMAAAHLLSIDGAGMRLNDAAWWSAYDYYGHDAYGIRYADEVLARAIGWSQHGFCAGCTLNDSLARAVQAAYGAPVLAAMRGEGRAAAKQARGGRHRSK